MHFKHYDVNDIIFDKILTDLDVIRIDKFEDKSYYEFRYNPIYFKTRNNDKLMVQGKILNYYANKQIVKDSWKQVVLVKNEETDMTVEDSVDGQYAWFYIRKILLKEYTDKEIDTILKTHIGSELEDDKQYHYDWPKVSQNVQKLALCVKYDVNGAHADALCELFPRCRAKFVKMYKKRHTNIKYKKFFNYFVGMIKNKGYAGAYWWVVNRTTRILKNAIDEVGGILVYANTDGFCVMNPEHKLETSEKLGDFKLEHEGDVYVYTNRKKSPYILYQFGKELKGSCMTCVRNDIDLSKGQIVYYNRVKHGTDITYYTAENIVKEKVCVQ